MVKQEGAGEAAPRLVLAEAEGSRFRLLRSSLLFPEAEWAVCLLRSVVVLWLLVALVAMGEAIPAPGLVAGAALAAAAYNLGLIALLRRRRYRLELYLGVALDSLLLVVASGLYLSRTLPQGVTSHLYLLLVLPILATPFRLGPLWGLGFGLFWVAWWAGWVLALSPAEAMVRGNLVLDGGLFLLLALVASSFSYWLNLFYLRLERLALYDSLTGVPHRRYFLERLGEEVARCRRGVGYQFSLALLDVDGLKGVNDRYGHLAGDEALRAIARLLRQHLRASDVVARYGGDEFALLLPNSGMEEARRAMERVSGLLLGSTFSYAGQPLPLPAHSYGLAACPGDGNSAEALLEMADRDLYREKRGKP